jgi:predicted O-linked N-acetylglucosamine transferase (SPINDLY family)
MHDTGPSPNSLSSALDDLCEKATALLDAGQAEAAEQVYQAILAVEPKHPAANHDLGMLCMRSHRYEEGLSFLLAALEAKPETAEYWFAYIEALLLDGQVDAAQQALALGHRHGLEGKAFANLALRLKNYEQVRASAERATPTASKKNVLKKAKRQSASPKVKDDAILAELFNKGRYREGAELSLAMTKRFPQHGFAWKVLGANLQKLGQDALPALRKGAELLPDDAQAHCNLGIALVESGQPETALPSFERALKIDPNYADAHFNEGVILQGMWQLDSAVASYRRAVAIRPDFAAAYINLGATLRYLGRSGEAEDCCRLALAIKSDSGEALGNLGLILEERGQLDSAVEYYRQALKIDPCYASVHSNLLCCLNLSETVDAQSLLAEHRRFAEQFEAPWRVNWPQHTNLRDPGRCLKIGFVSGDLRNHPIASFIEPVLAHLAGSPQLSLHAYSNHACVDEVTLRLSKYFAHWHPVFGVSDDVLAQKIRADGIDILIDLSGHTGFNRLPCFARKPAPVQASWMGFPCTTGLAAIDYYFADRFFLPPGQFDAQFTEKIVRLPAGAPFLPSKDAPLVNALPALSNGFVTFGSFNRINKLSHAVVSLWARLMRSLPDSRLLVGGMPVDGNHDTLIEWFAQEGIDRERLSFHVRSSMAAYFEMHHHVDICLDTFPFNGGTTTFHALWMGVPTLNLAGATAAGRSGATILGNVGLAAFVTSTKADFVQKGQYWAEHLAELAGIRAGLRIRFEQSAAGQPKLIAVAFEHALRAMWQRWCAGLPADSFDVS